MLEPRHYGRCWGTVVRKRTTDNPKVKVINKDINTREKYGQLRECEPGWVCHGLGQEGRESFPKKNDFWAQRLHKKVHSSLYSDTCFSKSCMIGKLENGAHIR